MLGLAACTLAADVGFVIISAATLWGTHYPRCLQAVVQMVFTLPCGVGKGVRQSSSGQVCGVGPVVCRCIKGSLGWRNVPPPNCFLSSHWHLFTGDYRAITPAETASTSLCAAGEIREDEQGGILP